MADTYYVEHGRRPLNCWDCDNIRGCKCSRLRVRNVKRGARQVWRARMREEALASAGHGVDDLRVGVLGPFPGY